MTIYMIRIKDGSRYRDLDRRECERNVDALDWFNSYPMQRKPILLLAPPQADARIVGKRPANT